MRSRNIAAELRELVARRARGQCEYCLTAESISLGTCAVDQIIAIKHGGESDQDNLAYCCSLCNRYKGTDVASYDALSGELTLLYHPRRQRWLDHCDVNPDGTLLALTAITRVTIRLLQLNRKERLSERRLLIQHQMLNLPQ
ncbi:MAG: HNH endonuclease [Anaerolineales bacterium]|nr:HNH endonuclease [Anaerolineales bacterium]